MRIVATLALMVLTLTLVTGCEDGEARQRADIQKSLTDAGKELRQVTAAGFVPGSDEFNKSRAGLDRVIKTLNAINPADDGQKAAKSLLTASALREAAIMDYAQASAIEARQQDRRDVILTKIDAITTLAAVAEGQQKIDAAPDARALDKERQAAMQRIEELSKRLEQLAGPIGERTSANDTAKKEVERLKTEVNNLRRQASQLGNADGFVTYQKAIETRRKADKIEYDISQREMELGYSLQPDHDLADEENKHLHTRVQALQSTHNELDAFSKATADSIAATRQQIVELSGEVAAEFKRVTDTAAAELAPLYEQAEAALQKAASMAGAGGAGSADDMSAARMLKARILELEGKFSAMKAARLADHQALLQKLNDAGKSIPSSDDLKQELDAAGAALTAAVDKAKASFTEAMDALSQVKSRDEAVELFRKNLENAVAVLVGQKLAPTPAPVVSESATAQPSPSSGARRTFATAQELYDFLANRPNTLGGSRESMYIYHAQTDDGKRFIQFSQNMVDGMAAIDEAMQTQFNTGIMNAMGGATGQSFGGDATSLKDARLTGQTDDRMVYTKSANGKTMEIVLKKINGTWWMDADGLAVQMGPMLTAMEGVGYNLKESALKLAERIRAGEFSNAQEATMAFAQSMASSIGGPNGMSGSPPGGNN